MFSEEEDSNETHLFQFNDETPTKKEERMKKLKSIFSKIIKKKNKTKNNKSRFFSKKIEYFHL